MAEDSKIQWTDDTWNPITGCSVVSRGCTNCYAMRLAGTRLQHHPSRAGLTRDTKAGPVWNGETRLNAEWLDQPLHRRAPRNIFVCAHGDLFHESVPDAWIDRVFAVMALASWHTFQVLTKRSARMREYMTGLGNKSLPSKLRAAWRNNAIHDQIAEIGSWPGKFSLPLPNVWLGVSAEDQPSADERLPDLLATPAAVRFVSCEPLLSGVDLRPWLSDDDGCEGCDDNHPGRPRCHRKDIPRQEQCPRNFAVFVSDEGPRDAKGCPEWVGCDRVTLDWVIVGGESGRNARPYGYEWARDLIEQCASAGVACFHKQVGAHPVGFDGYRVHLRDRKGGDPALWPEELRVREMPTPGGGQ